MWLDPRDAGSLSHMCASRGSLWIRLGVGMYYLLSSVCVAVHPVCHILVPGFRQVSWCVYCCPQVWVFQCARREGLGAAAKVA